MDFNQAVHEGSLKGIRLSFSNVMGSFDHALPPKGTLVGIAGGPLFFS